MTKPAIIKNEEATCDLMFGSSRVLMKIGSSIDIWGNFTENLIETISIYYLTVGK